MRRFITKKVSKPIMLQVFDLELYPDGLGQVNSDEISNLNAPIFLTAFLNRCSYEKDEFPEVFLEEITDLKGI